MFSGSRSGTCVLTDMACKGTLKSSIDLWPFLSSAVTLHFIPFLWLFARGRKGPLGCTSDRNQAVHMKHSPSSSFCLANHLPSCEWNNLSLSSEGQVFPVFWGPSSGSCFVPPCNLSDSSNVNWKILQGPCSGGQSISNSRRGNLIICN